MPPCGGGCTRPETSSPRSGRSSRSTRLLCAAHSSARVVNGANVDAKPLLKLRREPLALGRSWTVDANFLEWAHQRHRLGLGACLPTGPDQGVNRSIG